MDVNSQLLNAQLENVAADPANTPDGKVWLNTTDDKVKVVVATETKVVITEDDAANINITPTGNLASDNLVDALNELQTDIDNVGNIEAILDAYDDSIFDTTVGHEHDGVDSRKVLGTSINSDTALVKKVLTANGAGGSTWEQIGVPTGMVAPYAGTSSPAGWLLCDGSAVSRATYSALFAIIGEAHGEGDNSTTFNLPDYRGAFLRGALGSIGTNVTGSGSASSNNATFTGHAINRTGVPVRLASGTLSGLTTSTTYYAIVIDANTLAFATTLANALSSTKIAISGANSAVITQYRDPDASTRTAMSVGGVTGNNVGSTQEDELQSHLHSEGFATGSGGGYYGNITTPGNGVGAGNTGSTGGAETRPYNVYVNYIIKT